MYSRVADGQRAIERRFDGRGAHRVGALVLVVMALLAGCAGGYAAAIEDVLERDAVLGKARNHASEEKPLADAIDDYVAGLDRLDLGGCPPDFRETFLAHVDAWRESKPFFEKFDHLRGEMHDLFDLIRATDDETRTELERIEAAIWGTWDDVEVARKKHIGD